MRKTTIIAVLTSVCLADVAFAGAKVNASFTSEPEGATVVVVKRKSRKEIGTCITPCTLKLKAKHDFAVRFTKAGHASYMTIKNQGVETDEGLTFHRKLRSKEAILEKRRAEKARCAAKNLQPKGGDIDRNAQPLVRIVTKRPSDITQGESCKLKFDVNGGGRAENIKVLECPNPAFVKLSEKVLPKWRYVNQHSDGCPIPKSGVEATITFN